MVKKKSSFYNQNKKLRGSKEYFLARKKVLARDDECYLCGNIVDKTLKRYQKGSPEVDHIIPISRGGHPHSMDNLALSHRACNQLKAGNLPGTIKQKQYDTVGDSVVGKLEPSGINFLKEISDVSGDENE